MISVMIFGVSVSSDGVAIGDPDRLGFSHSDIVCQTCRAAALDRRVGGTCPDVQPRRGAICQGADQSLS